MGYLVKNCEYFTVWCLGSDYYFSNLRSPIGSVKDFSIFWVIGIDHRYEILCA